MPRQNLILVGFGNVGRNVARLLTTERERFAALGLDAMVVAICTGRRGSLLDPHGIDLARALAATEFPVKDMPARDIILQTEADIVVEMSPLNITSGQPAISHVEAALDTGKHVVSANKGPIAWDYRRLRDLARRNGKRLLFESAVMDGTPIFNMARHTLRGSRVTGFWGVLNSTSNFVLERMAQGLCMDAAVKEAQAGGFAETDPSIDLLGWDSAAKVAVLANVLMDADANPNTVVRQGITGVTALDLSMAASRGNTIRLVCRGVRDPFALSVAPAEVPLNSEMGSLSGTSSVVTIATDLLGDITIIERDPTINQTAFGVIADILEIVSST